MLQWPIQNSVKFFSWKAQTFACRKKKNGDFGQIGGPYEQELSGESSLLVILLVFMGLKFSK